MLHTTTRRLIAASLLAAALPAAAQPTGDGPVKVYLMMGQSNMEGWGAWYDQDGNQHPGLVDPTDPFPLTQADVNGYTAPLNQVWVNHPRGDKATGPLEPGFGARSANGTNIGIELSMGHELAANNTNPLYFYKSDRGGTSLFSDWRPPSAVAERGGSIGGEYTKAIKGFHNLLNSFDTQPSVANGAGYEVAGMVWLQGWNDYNTTGAPEYEANLAGLVSDVRYDLGLADLPVIIADAPRDTTNPLHEQVATAKQSVVNALNAELPGSAVYVDSQGVGVPSDAGFFHWNFTASNYIEMGKRNATGAQSVMRSTEVNHAGSAEIDDAWDRFRDNYSRTVRYEVDEASGTAVFNTAGGGSVADAVLSDAAARSAGLNGSSGSLDANKGVIRATHDLGASATNFTLGAWVQLDEGLADAQADLIFMSGEDSASTGVDSGYNLGVQRKQVNGEWVNTLYFDTNKFSGTSTNDSLGRDDILLEEGKAYFVAFVRNHDLTPAGQPESDDNTAFYLYDPETGTLHTNDAGEGSRQGTVSFLNTRVGIGLGSDNLLEDEATRFQGLIDDAQLWNVSLTETDILSLAQQGSLFVVPEPSSLGLLALGGLLLGVRRRRG